MKKNEKKFDIKELLTFKNFIILGLIAIIVIMLLTDKTIENKKLKEGFKINLNPNKDYTVCQRIYHSHENSMNSIASCDGSVYISKNDGEDKKLDIENVAYIYSFLTISDNLVYILTKSGEVYYLPTNNILNEQYTLEKLDLKEITSITEFYVGKTKDDAFSSRIYAIDKDGNFHLIKSGN